VWEGLGRHQDESGANELEQDPAAEQQVLTLVTALGCGLIAGVFFAFSSFVMAALKRLPSAQGIAAMQSINVAAVTPAFMTALLGTAAACVAAVVWSVVSPDGNSPALVIAGAATYLAGVVGRRAPATSRSTIAWRRWSPRTPGRRRCGTSTSNAGPHGTTCARSPRWPRPWH